jgi:hypothetical protein
MCCCKDEKEWLEEKRGYIKQLIEGRCTAAGLILCDLAVYHLSGSDYRIQALIGHPQAALIGVIGWDICYYSSTESTDFDIVVQSQGNLLIPQESESLIVHKKEGIATIRLLKIEHEWMDYRGKGIDGGFEELAAILQANQFAPQFSVPIDLSPVVPEESDYFDWLTEKWGERARAFVVAQALLRLKHLLCGQQLDDCQKAIASVP